MPTIQEINELIAKGPQERQGMSPKEVAEAFLADFEYPLGMVGAAKKWLSEDAIYCCCGRRSCSEKAQMDTRLQRYNAITRRPYGHTKIERIIANGNTVMVERVLDSYDRDPAIGEDLDNFPVAIGTIIKVNDQNEICEWQDYYDITINFINTQGYRMPSAEQVRELNDSLGFAPPSKVTNCGTYNTATGDIIR